MQFGYLDHFKNKSKQVKLLYKNQVIFKNNKHSVM